MWKIGKTLFHNKYMIIIENNKTKNHTAVNSYNRRISLELCSMYTYNFTLIKYIQVCIYIYLRVYT
jgi:hypothetical protein